MAKLNQLFLLEQIEITIQKDGLFDCFIYESTTDVNYIRNCGIVDI